MTTKDTSVQLILFSKLSILIFSILSTYFCGAIMLAYNLRQIGKGKTGLFVFIGSMIVYALLLQVVKGFTDATLFHLLIPNAIVGILLAYPCWDYLLVDVTSFYPKKPFIPALFAFLIWGSLICFVIFEKK